MMNLPGNAFNVNQLIIYSKINVIKFLLDVLKVTIKKNVSNVDSIQY